LSAQAHQFAEANAALIGIGNGTVDQMNEWLKEIPFAGECFTDPDCLTYQACGFNSGFLATYTWSGVKASIAASNKGYKVSGLKGWSMQLGGIIIVNKQGELLHKHIAETTHDHPSVESLISHCK